MQQEQPYRPTDVNQLAKYVVDLAIGKRTEGDEPEDDDQIAKRVTESLD